MKGIKVWFGEDGDEIIPLNFLEKRIKTMVEDECQPTINGIGFSCEFGDGWVLITNDGIYVRLSHSGIDFSQMTSDLAAILIRNTNINVSLTCKMEVCE